MLMQEAAAAGQIAKRRASKYASLQQQRQSGGGGGGGGGVAGGPGASCCNVLTELASPSGEADITLCVGLDTSWPWRGSATSRSPNGLKLGQQAVGGEEGGRKMSDPAKVSREGSQGAWLGSNK